jgi:hypothetical protein
MESIAGESDVDLSMLWNPSFNARGTPGFVW